MELQIYHSVQEVDPTEWDAAGGGRAFSSHRWTSFGEAVMAGCQPTHLLLREAGALVGRASFWTIRTEPIPIASKPLRALVQAWLRQHPLFICRSPLSNTGGMTLPEPPKRGEALALITRTAEAEARKLQASFVIFDYLSPEEADWGEWDGAYQRYSFSDPGTAAAVTWKDFEDYLGSLGARGRKHYRQRCREAESAGIRVAREEVTGKVDEALPLIRSVERRHASSPNPWVEGMLEHMGMVDSAWITARENGRLLGCELVLADGGAQMVTALGLAEGVSNIYHLLGYEDIRHAIASRAQVLHWGSGSYETKRRFGFEKEANEYLRLRGLDPFSRALARLLAR